MNGIVGKIVGVAAGFYLGWLVNEHSTVEIPFRRGRDRLGTWLAHLHHEFTTNVEFFPKEIRGPFGTHGCMYDSDDGDEQYVTVGFNLPAGVFAEIEDGTCGELQGFRIYYPDAELADIQHENVHGEIVDLFLK